jgi:lipopolysaccharide export LptBFGC system permease protein LptF
VIAKTQVENGTISTLIGIWWVPALLAVLITILFRRTGKAG